MRPSKKRSSAFLTALLCAVALIMVACGGGGSTSTPAAAHTKAAQSQQVYISGVEVGTADILSFDPALAPDFFSASAIENVFTGLVQLGDDLKVHTQLASSYQVSADNLTYTFTLRPNLKFSDGTPLTSADVVYSMDRALQPATQSGTAPYYMRYIKDASKLAAGSIKTIIGDSLLAPDANTVVVKAASPVAFFIQSLTYPASFVVEKSVVTKYGKN